MMRRPYTRRKKSPPGHRAPHGAVYRPGHGPEGAGAATPTGPRQDYAPLWPAVPGPRESVCELGAPDGNPTAGNGARGGAAGADRTGAGPEGDPTDRGPAEALGHHADPRSRHPSADHHPIPVPHPRQATDAA